MFLICGLGNPGVNYKNTRHNVGFHLADNIISHFNLNKIKEDKIKELYSGVINNQKIFVLKPLTFMNLSGKAVSEIVNFYKIKLDHTFVIHDDLDLELSKVKIKQGGGNGGHNGLESIDQFIGENYFRIRIGIDHPGHKDLVSSYVLNKFLKSELLKPTKIYVKEIINIISKNLINGCANITGGGLADNIKRVIPDNMVADIDLNKIKTLKIFNWLKKNGIPEIEMLKTFNCGVGFCLIINKKNLKKVQSYFPKDYKPYVIGKIINGKNKVKLNGSINWNK